MVAKRAFLVLTLMGGLAVAGQPTSAAAQHYGRGGHAVPRGGAGGYRSGSGYGGAYGYPARGGYDGGGGYYGYPGRGGSYGYHGRGYYGGHYGRYYGGYYGRHYAPHYGRYYAPYYGPFYGYYPYGSLGFYYGWPYGYSRWWPSISVRIGHSGYPTYPAYAADYGSRMEAPSDDDSRGRAPDDGGRLRLAVTPGDAVVYVDDEFRGSARETRAITLRTGRHTIEVARPGFAPVRREVTVTRGETRDVLLQLQRP